ncbi:MAG TPA: hypothetical protein VHX42_03530 [Candidatus Babeliales bacterium]|jgi:hypothetical protein|nr:hypothetical protein [Candidatus Babeliales bacterium]
MNKQITTLMIVIALINLTTHAMEHYINHKKIDHSYINIIHKQYPHPRKKLTREEIIHNIIHDKSPTTDKLQNALIGSIIHQLELREIIAQ